MIAAVALGLYLAGFRLTALKFKLGLLEATATRKPAGQAPGPTAAPACGIEQVQEASGPGSLIARSSQQASAPGTRQRQSATGFGRAGRSLCGLGAAGKRSQFQVGLAGLGRPAGPGRRP